MQKKTMTQKVKKNIYYNRYLINKHTKSYEQILNYYYKLTILTLKALNNYISKNSFNNSSL